MSSERNRRFVYIIESIAMPGRFYTGVTSDMAERLADHNAGRSPHTASGRPWETSVVIQFKSESTAMAFEKYLKSGSGVAFSKKRLRPARFTERDSFR
jgi:predicted GIY-YIG superfamily endonuclease